MRILEEVHLGLQGGLDIVPVRLKNAVLRIVGRSKHRNYYLQQMEQLPGASPASSHVCPFGPNHARTTLRVTSLRN